MAVVQIPNLPAVAIIDGQALFEAVQFGVSYKVSLRQIAQYTASFITPYILPTGYVTTYQFMRAVASVTGNANTLYALLPADFNDAATAQFFTSSFVAVDSPLYTSCQTAYGYTDLQMANLMQVAATIQPWG